MRLSEPLVSPTLYGGSETPGAAEVRRGDGGDETSDMAKMRRAHGENETLTDGGDETLAMAEMGLRLTADETHFKFFKIL